MKTVFANFTASVKSRTVLQVAGKISACDSTVIFFMTNILQNGHANSVSMER